MIIQDDSASTGARTGSTPAGKGGAASWIGCERNLSSASVDCRTIAATVDIEASDCTVTGARFAHG